MDFIKKVSVDNETGTFDVKLGEGTEEFEIKQIAYGFQIASFENVFTVLSSPGQDGKVPIVIIVCEIDGTTRTIYDGKVSWDEEHIMTKLVINEYTRKHWLKYKE